MKVDASQQASIDTEQAIELQPFPPGCASDSGGLVAPDVLDDQVTLGELRRYAVYRLGDDLIGQLRSELSLDLRKRHSWLVLCSLARF